MNALTGIGIRGRVHLHMLSAISDTETIWSRIHTVICVVNLHDVVFALQGAIDPTRRYSSAAPVCAVLQGLLGHIPPPVALIVKLNQRLLPRGDPSKQVGEQPIPGIDTASGK